MLPKIIIFVAITASVWSLNDHVRLVLKLSVALQGSSIRVNRAEQVSQGLSIISQAGIGKGRGGPLSSAQHPVGLGDLTSIPNTSTCPSTLRTSMHMYSQDVHKTTLGWIQIPGYDIPPLLDKVTELTDSTWALSKLWNAMDRCAEGKQHGRKPLLTSELQKADQFPLRPGQPWGMGQH